MIKYGKLTIDGMEIPVLLEEIQWDKDFRQHYKVLALVNVADDLYKQIEHDLLYGGEKNGKTD